MKKKFGAIRNYIFGIVLVFLGVIFFAQPPDVIFAGTLTNPLKDRLSSLRENQATGISHTVVFQTSGAVSGGSGNNKIIMVFPDSDDTKWCRMAGTDLAVVGCTEDSSTVLPGTLSAICTQGSGVSSYDTLEINGINNLSAATTYCVQVSDGSTATLGTPSATSTGVITVTTNNGVSDVDSERLTVDVITNDQVTVTATVPGSSPPPSGGGGGGGGSSSETIVPPGTTVVFVGKSSPNTTVFIVKDGQIIATTTSDSEGNFRAEITGITGGTYVFSVLSQNAQGEASDPLTFSVEVGADTITTISGIVVEGSLVLRGDVNSDKRVGLVDLSIMLYWFGNLNAPTALDLNFDKKIDLVDFSIMAYYWTG